MNLIPEYNQIIQSSNQPIIINFSEDASEIPALRVSLWDGEKMLKLWTKDDVQIDGQEVTLPLTQAETAKYREGKVSLLIKWLDADGITEFGEEDVLVIRKFRDRVPMECR